ncbi:thiaminase II [Thalassospira sp.]|uniref:thiaminase II n=1 Tax=Thalassospira sp. TaxID=1912094 RepID=UPI0027345D8C|nr:thiaminase II [Thalassospira sp.]MDP2700149.1 thiaminase II [Thalassospira sp.]
MTETFTDIIPPHSLFGRLRAKAPDAWQAYVCHEFVRKLGDGTLSGAAFKHYLVQDYLFLIQFARAYALAVYKADDLTAMRQFSGIVHAILDMEMSLHLEFCAGWGLSEADIVAMPESRATVTYTRYVLEKGMQGDVVDLQVALMPCMVGYAEIANRLIADPATRLDGNPYRAWIEMYASAEFQDVAKAEISLLDHAAAQRGAEGRIAGLTETFAKASQLEADFWQMGLDLAK